MRVGPPVLALEHQDVFSARLQTLFQKRTFKGLATSAGRKAPSLARSFAKQMFQGKCHSAFQLLEEETGSAGVLRIICCHLVNGSSFG